MVVFGNVTNLAVIRQISQGEVDNYLTFKRLFSRHYEARGAEAISEGNSGIASRSLS